MGHLNDNDPANTRAATRSRLGLARETQIYRTGHYPLWFRTKAINVIERHGSIREAARMIGCSTSSLQRWGHRILPYRMSGNNRREQLIGADQLLLSICLFIYPDATADQIDILIYSNGGDIYTRPQIYDRCRELELTRKRSSKESYDVFSPASQRSLVWFKTLPPPLGVHDLPVHY